MNIKYDFKIYVINLLDTKINVNYISRLSSHYVISRSQLGYKNQSMYSKIIAVCSEIHTKHINILSGQNVQFFNGKPHGK
jgi:hypothetical protein